MRYELVLLDGTGRRFPLHDGTELTVGAAAHCGIRLNASDVSRTHALISCRRGRITVLDLGSKNGTFVGGKSVKEAPLTAGAVVRFSSVLAQILPEATPSSGAGPEEPGSVAGDPDSADTSKTGDLAAVMDQSSLVGLFTRWAAAGGSAVGALLEWLTSEMGVSGATALDSVADEVLVRGAAGSLHEVLAAPAVKGTICEASSPSGRMATIQLEVEGEEVLAVNGGGSSWLVLALGDTTPATGQLELFVRLLEVANRLDA